MSWTEVSGILFNILTYGVFLYSVVLLLTYILIALYSIGETRKYIHKNSFTDYRILASSSHTPTVTILAPAYNEGKTIVENVKSLLSIYYTNLEVIIINDGSKDDCLEKLINAYDLEKKDFFVNEQIATKEIRGIYKSRNSIYHKLIVVDKVNGGKADALNVGINVSSNKLLVCIDVDCVLEQDALLKMVKPFMEETNKRVIATGGVVRIANSCVIEDGRLIKVKLAEDYLPRIQILEYIRAFILGRMAWSRLNGLMLISGAFGAFDKEIVIKCGGYNHATVGEDMELVVRMRRYMEEKGEEYMVTYIPDPLCWTEAPVSFTILGRQRNRWIRGTYETLKFHKIMFLNPKYGILGMVSYPYWFFFEMWAPVIEFFGFIFFFIFAWTGFLDWGFFFSFFLFIVCFGYLYSSFAILMEVVTFNQYKRRIDVLRLMLTGLTEPFYYHPFVVWSAIKGYLDLIKKKKGWGEMTRQGFAKKTPAPQPIPVAVPSSGTGVGTIQTATVQAIQPVIQEEEEKAAWVMERSIVPFIARTIGFIVKSLKRYISLVLTFLLFWVGVRAFELIYDTLLHGVAEQLGKIIMLGLVKDIAFFFEAAACFYPVYAFFYIINKTAAKLLFCIVAILLLLIQVALVQYFLRTLVPLGADLWSYSIADIKQTVGASGGIKAPVIIGFSLLLALAIFLFTYLPKRIKINGWGAFFFLLLFSLAVFTKAPQLAKEWMPGKEYSNNLSINKTRYFLEASRKHFFPVQEDLDIYSSSYSGDYSTSDDDASLFKINYIDEKNFPFLHKTDSTNDVLSPYFDTSAQRPNIVILVIEGLGRAFSNKLASLGNFTPFLDSLSGQSLYWSNFLSEGGRTFAVLPSVLGSLPFAQTGFAELGNAMPQHFSLMNLLVKNGYSTSFYYGGDSHFDNMDLFMQKNSVGSLNDEKTFPAGYTKMPAMQGGFTWGYGDKELYRRYFETKKKPKEPYLDVLLTISTHDPFLINDQETYLRLFESRMTALGFSEDIKKQHRNYSKQFASIISADDAIRNFINEYKQRPEFAHTVFVITGDHRMPEIPLNSKIDRYHVPMIIYSPLLKRNVEFSSISSHFDITPSLLAWLKKSYGLQLPDTVSWMGTGLDTTRVFRNIHAYPIMQSKTDMVDFIMGNYLLNGNSLFRINSNMDLEPVNNPAKADELKAAFSRFKGKNEQFLQTQKILPDSLLQKYVPN
jgi:cellulose synthase/poly-beta-1,6-N-acetylglucosamine synthase-like glycosyltransferase/phosphoglycerol transferase MdoB-like AlkP superfamily enzyme